MREYKYKGYAKEEYIKSQWFIGYGVRKCQMWEAPDKVFLLTEHNGEIEVYKETVGEFTGINDKNGVEIYEGDIVRSLQGAIQRVYYSNQFAAFLCTDIYRPNGEIGDTWIVEKDDEVIGNIYENPELLERGA